MSKAIKELERKKREEERKKLMQRAYETPTPPYAPPLLSKGSSNLKEKLMARERSRVDAEGDKRTFENAGWKCRVVEEISRDTRHPTGIWEVWCTTSGSSNPNKAALVKPEIIRMLQMNIDDEKKAAKQYIMLAQLLKEVGLMEEANIIARISASEVGHEEELKAMLARFRLERMIR